MDVCACTLAITVRCAAHHCAALLRVHGRARCVVALPSSLRAEVRPLPPIGSRTTPQHRLRTGGLVTERSALTVLQWGCMIAPRLEAHGGPRRAMRCMARCAAAAAPDGQTVRRTSTVAHPDCRTVPLVSSARSLTCLCHTATAQLHDIWTTPQPTAATVAAARLSPLPAASPGVRPSRHVRPRSGVSQRSRRSVQPC